MSIGAKIASLAGQDLRAPLAGGTKMPTDDSKGPAENLLERSQTSAEVGPSPSLGQLNPRGPSIQDLAVKMPSTKGSLPKLGSQEMNLKDKIANDPLVRYLQKEGMQLEVNLDEMPKGQEEEELSAAPPQVPKEFAARALHQQDDLLAKLFGVYKG